MHQPLATTLAFRRSTLAALATLAVVLAGMLLLPGIAHAEIEREILSNAKPSNLVNISPIQIEADVEPGVRSTQLVAIFNDSSVPVRLRPRVVDLGPPNDEILLAVPLEGEGKFGAKGWITVEITDTILQPFERIKFEVVIDPPADAPVGASYGGVEFDITGQLDGSNANPTESGAQIGIRIVSVLQLLLTVPGEVNRDLKLLEAKTRDSFHLGGTSFVTYGVRYRNDGTVNDHIKGKVVISSLFGNEVESIKLRELIIIRGGTRIDRVTWSDPPSFGIFSAKAQIKGDDGKLITKDMGRVYLLPPWWLIALIVGALVAAPVYLWWRRRREWMQYLDDEDLPDEDLAY